MANCQELPALSAQEVLAELLLLEARSEGWAATGLLRECEMTLGASPGEGLSTRVPTAACTDVGDYAAAVGLHAKSGCQQPASNPSKRMTVGCLLCKLPPTPNCATACCLGAKELRSTNRSEAKRSLRSTGRQRRLCGLRRSS